MGFNGFIGFEGIVGFIEFNGFEGFEEFEGFEGFEGVGRFWEFETGLEFGFIMGFWLFLMFWFCGLLV